MVGAGRQLGKIMRTITLGLAAAAAVILPCNAIAAAAWHIESLPDSAPL